MEPELEKFVRESLAEGAEPEQIRSVLAESGWDDGEVDAALRSWRGVAFGLAVPRPRPYLSAADAFGMLLLFTLLFGKFMRFCGQQCFVCFRRGDQDMNHVSPLFQMAEHGFFYLLVVEQLFCFI